MHVIAKRMQTVSGRPSHGKCAIREARRRADVMTSRGVSRSASRSSSYASLQAFLPVSVLTEKPGEEIPALVVTTDVHKQASAWVFRADTQIHQ